jgi:hypothetical protein
MGDPPAQSKLNLIQNAIGNCSGSAGIEWAGTPVPPKGWTGIVPVVQAQEQCEQTGSDEDKKMAGTIPAISNFRDAAD